MVFELLKTGNFQAKVIKSVCNFKKGQNVNLMLVSNDMVLVSDIVTEYTEELNLDTHSDYDEYFKIY